MDQTPAPPAAVPDQRSAMLERFGILARLLVRLLFQHVRVRPEAVERIRQLAEQGTLIYVMRYRSVVDYLLANAVLLREGLPLARFAPGVSTLWFRPLRDALGWLARRGRPAMSPHLACRGLLARGEPVLLFMRSRTVAARRRRALSAARLGPQYLRDAVRATEASGRPVFLIPLAIFRGKGFQRRESRLATLIYSVQEAPGEAKRLFNYLWNAEETQLTLGREIALDRFVEDNRREGEERLVRRLARALAIFLYREERVVSGPTLLPRRLVRRTVLRDGELARLVRRMSAERAVRRGRIWREARGYFDEIAANYNGFYFGIIEAVFKRIWPRVSSGLEIIGLEKVADCVGEHPVVLVPCHRSHFDYLIISYIFHENYLSPPHIAAGNNLSFWPLGPIFRGAGAYFLRRTFDDNELYKMVFRKYVAFLIREGYTQEFFIEGGRSRTGKLLPAKLGLLSMMVNAFVQGVRRDLYLVPVSIHYGRIPEEEAYRREVSGEEKEKESLLSLLRARSILSRRFGTSYVSFGDPISLAAMLGEQRERFRAGGTEPAIEEEKRRTTQRIGFQVLREINAVAVAGATSISATALLGAPRPACRLNDFAAVAGTLIEMLRVRRLRVTSSLERNATTNFRESLRWLADGGLIERIHDNDGVVLHVPAAKRVNLDFYKNNTIHFFLVPSLLTRALLAGVPFDGLAKEIAWWLDLYRWEFPLPERGEALAIDVTRWITWYRERGAIVGDTVVREHPIVRATSGVLENFREAYAVAACTIAAQKEWPITRQALLQRMKRQFQTSLLLGEAQKPEGNNMMLFGNALTRVAELGHVKLEKRGRERWVDRGPASDGLPELIRRFGTWAPQEPLFVDLSAGTQ
jgi:glycerol-3-phosphate O-acyltransferase